MSLVNTLLQNLRLSNLEMSKNVNRRSVYGALDVAKRQTESPTGIITEAMQENYRSSIGRTVQIPVFDSEAITITSTRPLTISNAENTSQLLAVSSTVFSFGFTMTPSQHLNNEFTYQQDFNQKMMKRIYAMGAALDSDVLSKLNTNKNQVWGWDGSGLYDVSADIFGAGSWAAADRLFGDAKIAMNANDYYGMYDLIMNPGLQSKFEDVMKQGLYNDKNEAMQLGGFEYATSNRLTDASGYAGTGYLISKDNIGLMFRHEREALFGRRLRTGHEWGIGTLPMLNVPCDTYYYENAVDASSLHGGTADMTRVGQEYFHFAVEMAVVVAYNNSLSTIANPIMKIGYKSGN